MTLQDLAQPGASERIAKLGTAVQDVGVRPLIRKDGSIVLMRVVTHPIDYRGKPARYSVHTDVSGEQAAIECELEAKAWFEDFFHSSSECIVIIDTGDGRIVKCNPAFQQMTGFTESELRGM